MEPGYKIENAKLFKISEIIIVSNYWSNNTVVNLPCIKKSVLLKRSLRDETSIGFWKIKNKTQ